MRILMMCALAAAMVLPSLAEARPVDERWPLNADGSVSVDNVAGVIEVSGWDRDEVSLTGELGDSVEELDISHSDDRLVIRVDVRNGRHTDDTDLNLRVPFGARLRLEAVSADIEIRDMDSPELLASSVSGDVEVMAAGTRTELNSVSGDIRFAGRAERLRAESVSGTITLDEVAREVEVSTVSGDVELRAGTLQRARFETVSGDLELDMGLADDGRMTVESMSGDVTVTMPAGQGGEFRAQTFSGSIRTPFGRVDREGRGPGERFEHVEGSSSATMRLESFSGDITLK